MKFFKISETFSPPHIQKKNLSHYLLKKPLLLFFCLLVVMFSAIGWQDNRQRAHIVKTLAFQSADEFSLNLPGLTSNFLNLDAAREAARRQSNNTNDSSSLSDEFLQRLNKRLKMMGQKILAQIHRLESNAKTSNKALGDEFIDKARTSLRQNPNLPFSKVDGINGQPVFRLAKISSPLRGPKAVKSRVILEITVPLGTAVELSQYNKMNSITILIISAVLMFAFFALVLRNLNQEKTRAETLLAKAQQADMLKTEFLSTTSHELRTPLTAISGSLSIVLSNALGEIPEKPGKLLKIAHDNCSRLTVLVNDILDVNKMIAGEMIFNLEPHGLSELIDKAIDSNRGYAEYYNTKFNWNPLEEEVLVNVDANRFQQIMSNLMSNAVKFSPAGEDVEITVTSTDEFHRISVIDKGPGIPDDFKERVFDRFSQADSSDTKPTGGTGLGLRITKMIVEEFGGTIGFESEEGHGATFFFDLNVYHPESPDVDMPQIEAIAS